MRISFEQALALCRSDPAAAARLICELPEADIRTFYDYRLDACPECGNAGVTFLDEPPRVLQQMEIEKVVVFKEEHRSYPVWCERCQKVHYHPFPEAIL